MFEGLKIKKILKKMDDNNDVKGFYKLYKNEIENNYDIFLKYINKCVETNIYIPSAEESFQESFKKYFSKLDENLLYQISEKVNCFELLINKGIYPSLPKEIRFNLIANNYYLIPSESLDIIPTEDIIHAYKLNKKLDSYSKERLIYGLNKRLQDSTKEELIKYIEIDEDIVLIIPFEKIVTVIDNINLSENLLYELYKKNNELIKHIKKNYSSLLYIMKQEPKEINNILLNMDVDNIIELYNLNKEFFNKIFIEHPDYIKDHVTLIAYILMNNEEILKKYMSVGIANNEIKINDFFLDNDIYCNILTKFGSQKFIEFLKLYPLFGASEKEYVPKIGASDYGEKQMYHNQHYYLKELINIEEAYKLINIDINYLFNIYDFTNMYQKNDYNLLKQNILNLLNKKILENGLEEKCKDLSKSVNKIFEFIKEDKILSVTEGYQSFKIKKYELIKLLFNIDIISKNSADDINDYIECYYNDSNDCQQKFYKIFENAYGKKALEIIKSRPGLDPLTINSFEIFRPEIINNFNEGFVHDLLSYNIKGFTNFLIISKDSKELNLFIDYYNCLTKIFGENVVTMEKAFINFYYYKDLIESVQNKELTEIEQQNFISIISGNFNYNNINSKDELNNYNIQADQNLLNLLRECKSELEYKNIICNDLFGIDYIIFETSYEFAINELSKSSNTKDFIDSLSESEKNIMEFLKFICDPSKTFEELQTFVENIVDSKNIRNSISCASLLDKIRAREIEEINKSLLTQKFIDDNEFDKKEYDGVPIYCYSEEYQKDKAKKGLLFSRILQHDAKLSLAEMNVIEPDNGVSTISTWYHSFNPRSFGFYQVPLDTQIVASGPHDGETSKLAKSVHAQGKKGEMGYNSNGIYVKPNYQHAEHAEISFYRRHRNHKNITNKNHGGLIIPNCLYEISLKNIEYAKQCNGIIICSYEDYYKFLKEIDNEKGEKQL